MPIDFAAIAATFRPPLALQTRSITLAFQALGLWLRDRLQEARLLEQATRDYPVVRFRNTAVTAWIDTGQHGTLVPETPPPGALAGVASGARRFVAGLGYVTTSVNQEMLLPRLLGALERFVGLVAGSVERFVVTEPGKRGAVFDRARTATAIDLFGGLGMGARAWFTGGARSDIRGYGIEKGSQISELLAQVDAVKAAAGAQPWGTLLDLFGEVMEKWGALAGGGKKAAAPIAALAPAGGGGGAPAAMAAPPAAAGGGLADTLGMAVRGIAAALLVIPMVGGVLEQLLRGGTLLAKTAVLTRFAAIEEKVFGLRRRVIDLFFVDLRKLGGHATDLLWAAGLVLQDNLYFVSELAVWYAHIVTYLFGTYLRQLVEFVAWIVNIAETVRSVIDAILDVDLWPLLLGPLVTLLPAAVRSKLPKFTLDHLVSAGTAAATEMLRLQVREGLRAIRLALWASPVGKAADYFSGSPVANRLEAAQEIVDKLLAYPGMLERIGKPKFAYTPLGDVYGAMIGAELPAFRYKMRGLAVAGRETVFGVLTTGAGMLDDAAATFGDEAHRAALLGSVAEWREVGTWSAELGEMLFGDQVAELSARPMDPLGRAFEAAVAKAGFHALGAAIPAYVGAMSRYWAGRAPELSDVAAGAGPGKALYPLSKHKLSKRFLLGRVRMPRLVLRARGQAAGPALAETVAAFFRGEVAEAYAAGLRQVKA